MTGAQTFDGFDERDEPGRGRSIGLALGVHLVLLAILFLGVRWQSHPAAPMTVELWRAPPPAPKLQQPPKVEPKPEPPPPPKVEPKPEPRIEKPDIAIKEPLKPKPPPPKSEPKPKPPPPKPVAKPQLKPAPPKDDEFRKQLQAQQAQLAKEEATIKAQQQDAELQQLLAAEAASDRSKALASWVDKIRAKIRGNIVLPPDLQGNPEAVFDVVQLPSGEVIEVKLRKSSGHPAYDAAVERAIRKSSPLPKPDRPDLFQRELRLRFWPRDNL